MRSRHAKVFVVVVCATQIACIARTRDTAHTPIFLPASYDALPPAPPGTPIEPGQAGQSRRPPAGGRRGECGEMDEGSCWVQFSGKKAVRNSRSLITVCGLVNGRNTAGHFVAFRWLAC